MFNNDGQILFFHKLFSLTFFFLNVCAPPENGVTNQWAWVKELKQNTAKVIIMDDTKDDFFFFFVSDRELKQQSQRTWRELKATVIAKNFKVKYV